MPIVIDDRKLIAGLKKLAAKLDNPEPALDSIGKRIKTYVQSWMASGGMGSWEPLSDWTIRRTGRTQPLVTLIPYIDYAYGRNTVSVYFIPQSKDWDLDMHHRGYTRPAIKGKLQAIPQDSEYFYTRDTGVAVTPARKIWPTSSECIALINNLASNWVDAATRSSFA